MEYITFVAGFAAIHLGAYILAGVITQQFSREYYAGPAAVFAPFLRDMSDPRESAIVTRRMVPAQLLRGLLMALVLVPILAALGELPGALRVAFLGGLMFVYADLSSAVPFSNTIEGWVYMKRQFVQPRVVLRVQAEAVLYSVIFGAVAGWLLFL